MSENEIVPQPITEAAIVAKAQAAVAAHKPPSAEEMRARFADFQRMEWNKAATNARFEMLKARGIQPDPSVEWGEEELKAMAPLEGDTMRYAKDKAGNPRMATDRAGFMATPKRRGRRKPHMTKSAQALKSAALHIFGGMFRKRIATVEAATTAKGETFTGLPQKELTKLAAKASAHAAVRVRENRAARRRRLRNESKMQRRINRGLIPGNTNRRAYTIN